MRIFEIPNIQKAKLCYHRQKWGLVVVKTFVEIALKYDVVVLLLAGADKSGKVLAEGHAWMKPSIGRY
jgi:3-hydroxyisobutyrate dehydrogenase-like beta-hydroxyacid dehydrogenase